MHQQKRNIMNSNYIPKQRKEQMKFVTKAKESKNVTSAEKEKREGIVAAIIFLCLMAFLTLFFWSDNVILEKLYISLFIISCLLLVKLSGPSKQ